MSYLRVGLLLTALTALLLWLGYYVGGPPGIIVALILGGGMNIVSYWFSDKIVLKMVRAQPVAPSQAPGLYSMVERLATRANLPMPQVYIVPDPSPNAFATGRDPAHAVVAVNQGLLNSLSEAEVEGVVAHELGHVKHRDTLTMAIVATVAGGIMAISFFLRIAAMFGGGGSNDREGGGNPLVLLGIAIVAPFAAMLVQMGISRVREYEADRFAAELVGSGKGLQSALLNLERGNQVVHSRMPEAAAHMCIVNPLTGRGFAALFSTHPPIEDRVRKLQELEPELQAQGRAASSNTFAV